jgi:uncharacterized membrane protein
MTMAASDKKIQPSPLPETHSEVVTAAVHYYRAELARMAGWRDRIDRTTNWAITVVAALLSVSLSTASAHHGVLLFAMLLVYLLLMIEARRYRFFDVYRFRVRQLERHYFAQVFSPAEDFSANWTQILGQSLRQPKFFISYGDAFSRRLRRNYIWMFLILLLAWVLKISTPRLQDEGAGFRLAHSLWEVLVNAGFGPIPGWLVVAGVAAFFLWLLYASLRAPDDAGEGDFGEVHV